MPRFTNRAEKMKQLARMLRSREGEIEAYDSSQATYARAKARIDADYPDGWGPLPVGTPVDQAAAEHKERAAAMHFRAQLDKLTSDTIRERTKVKYYHDAIEEELDEAGIDPVALLAEADDTEPEEE